MTDDSAYTAGRATGPVLALTVAYDGAPSRALPGSRPSDRARRAGAGAVGGAAAAHRDRRCRAHRHGRPCARSGRELPADGTELDVRALLRSLNALAGDGISVREARWARQGFSARFDAVQREYRYRIVAGPVPPLFLGASRGGRPGRSTSRPLREGAAHLLGEHDFRSFCVSESAEGKRTVRRVDSVEVAEEEHLGEQCLVVRVVGNALPALDGARGRGHARRGRERGGASRRWVAEALDACDRARPVRRRRRTGSRSGGWTTPTTSGSSAPGYPRCRWIRPAACVR